ncbi:carbohydrate ABC transporter permease [Mahella australiensis]|uniref:Binding-protein-dependent transport systems inner membrane component n=1 Tax=Mahella australiensis (strain DSM 15567 / CIP 107919 / 50-1 BON) TaxID=697281 RepID=F3ZZ53_MAHA5|nr:carbohydrate ABC transporter permease [Mahella australiensis]AEE97835.1 binding-protein-dependent transport systems inner membrane component [Mahella australiensis 50-1 BON]
MSSTKLGIKFSINKLLGDMLTILFIVIIVFPFYWQIITSLKHPADINMTPTELWPSRFNLQFYRNVFVNHHFGIYLKNSVIVAGGTMIITIVIALPASYAFVRLNFKFKNFWANFILAANMFPIIAVVTPLYVLFKNLGLINTYTGLIIPSIIITIPMAIWTLNAFLTKIPVELEEAAMVDGCTRFQSVIRIIIPLMGPGLFTTAIITFITAWNELMFALTLVTRDNMRTVPVAISMFPGQFTVPWGDMAAASIVATVPIVLVVLLFQKGIIAGLTAGAVKG